MDKNMRWNLVIIKLIFIMSITGCLSFFCYSKDDITFASFRDIGELNPHNYLGEIWANNMLYESLVRYNEDGSLSPWLAESWNITNNGKTYTFKLRKNVTFSDGAKFNAYSAKLNWNAMRSNTMSNNPWRQTVKLITKVKAIDSYTLRIELVKPYSPFLVELATTTHMRFISPNSMINGETKNGVKSYIGTGPYLLSEYKNDQYAVFKANPNYWGKKPRIKTVLMKVISDEKTRLMALKKGEIDLIYGADMVSSDSFEQFSQLEEFQTLMSKPVSTRYILMNTTRVNLTDIKVRQAIEHIIDKKSLVQKIFNNSEAPADTLFAKNIPYADIDLASYQYNIQQAEKLLDDAKWLKIEGQHYRQKKSKAYEITLYYDKNIDAQEKIAQYIQNEFDKVGLKLNIRGEGNYSYSKRLNSGNFDMFISDTWGIPFDLQYFLSSMTPPTHIYENSSANYLAQQALTEKEKIDSSIKKALISTDEIERQSLYSYVLKTLHNEAVYIPLTYKKNRAIAISSLKGIEFSPFRFDIPFDKMYFE